MCLPFIHFFPVGHRSFNRMWESPKVSFITGILIEVCLYFPGDVCKGSLLIVWLMDGRRKVCGVVRHMHLYSLAEMHPRPVAQGKTTVEVLSALKCDMVSC